MSLSNLSDLSLRLSNSRNYQRLTLLIFGFCIYFLFLSSLAIFLKLGFSFILLHLYQKIHKNPKPNPELVSLSYRTKNWQLKFRDDSSYKFEKHKILLEVGPFFLLELSSIDQRRILPIFFDQISAESYRKLRLMEKIL